MILNNKENWIFAVGIWFGVGASILSFSMNMTRKIQLNSSDGYIGIILGLLIIFFGFYSIAQSQKIEVK